MTILRKQVVACGLALMLSLTGTAAAVAQEQPHFTLKKIETGNSSYLTQEALRKVTDRYVNRPITFDDLQEMMSALQGLYVDAGVPTAQTLLPPQDIVGGVLRVSLVEAEIEDIRITGAKYTKPAFLRENLTLPVGAKPDFDQIERDLQIFTLSHDLMPGIDFSPGATEGGTIVTLTANEPKNLRFSGSLDNYGRDETGEARLTLGAQWASLTGWRDHLSISATRSRGAWSGSIGYDRPIGMPGGRAYVNAYINNSQVMGGSLSDAQIVSDGRGVSFGYRVPLIAEYDRSLSASLGFGHDQTKSSIAGIQFADTTINELTAEMTWQLRRPLTQWGARGLLRLGRSESVGGALSDGSYGVLHGTFWVNRQVSKNYALSANMDLQFSNRLQLPVSRQYSVGGTQNLRGYPLDVRVAPEAMVLRLQATRLEPFRFVDDRLQLQPFVFLDAAILAPARVTGSRITDLDKLASVGIGTSMRFDGNYGLQALAGLPLRDTEGFSKDEGATFYLGLSAEF